MTEAFGYIRRCDARWRSSPIHGGYDWIIMDEAIDFAAMFAEFDTFVMGRKTWDVSAATRVRATCSAAKRSSSFRGR